MPNKDKRVSKIKVPKILPLNTAKNQSKNFFIPKLIEDP
jgi:hypothetical protein